jgi:hypothetical protein
MIVIIKKTKLVLTFLIISLMFCSFAVIKNSATKHTVGNKSEYLILIYIDEKTLYLFEDGKCIKEYPVATGKKDWPSPIGDWEIVNKGDWGEGFGGRWLGLNVKWGEYGIHGTTMEYSIGSSASHGCIRMFNSDIKELYDIVPIGTRVIIRNGLFGPFGTGFRDLRPGDRGADVLAVQQRLKQLGYYNGEESGIYEDDLKKALYKFQKDNNLRIKYTITYPDYKAMGFEEFE